MIKTSGIDSPPSGMGDHSRFSIYWLCPLVYLLLKVY